VTDIPTGSGYTDLAASYFAGFAIIPEPASVTLLAIGGLVLTTFRGRGRR
jgi:hypothetical protein